MRIITSKSKNAESFYISKGYINDKGVSTSVIVRKLGTLKELLPEHWYKPFNNTIISYLNNIEKFDIDDVLARFKKQAEIVLG